MFTTLEQNAGSASGNLAGGVLGALVRPLTPAGLRGRRALKRFLYAQMALRQGLMIALGREQPLVPFTIEAEPPSVYWVHRLRPDVVDDLAARLGLPDGVAVAPIRCLAGAEPEAYLTLNVYRVSGLANGVRAEWSTYVDVGDGVPRYLVVDARSSQASMDPVDVITPASTVVHERDGRLVRTRVGDGPAPYSCTLELPEADDLDLVEVDHQWVTANDSIYWGNGVSDRTFYDAGLAAARQVDLPPTASTIDDRTPWADLVEPEPAHTLVLCDAVELVISPWENVDRLAADRPAGTWPVPG